VITTTREEEKKTRGNTEPKKKDFAITALRRKGMVMHR
jgi:hypothetical protein